MIAFGIIDTGKLIDMHSIKYTKGYKYKNAEYFSVKLPINPGVEYHHKSFTVTKDGWLIVEDTYCWDGASGPTIDTKNSMRGSCIHDVLYQLMRMGIIPRSFRKSADIILYKTLRQDGMWYTRAKPWYTGVRVGAGKYVKANARRKPITAP